LSSLPPDQIRRLAEVIAREIMAGGMPAIRSADRSSESRGDSLSGPPVGLGDGIYASLDDAVAAARVAYGALGAVGLEKRKEIIEAMRVAMREVARPLAEMAQQETGLGRADDKVLKNLLVTNKTPGPEVLEPEAISGDKGLVLMEPAPFGVIGAITPVTNPSSTIICNSIAMVSAGNAVVFNPHPNAKRVSAGTVRLLNRAIVKAGGPPNVLCCMAEPTIESANALMKHPRIRLVVVTGGGAVVAAAMNSGKRAICAGPGNPPAVVDQTAEIEKAGKDIIFGHSFDNNVICTDEKEVIAVDSITDKLKAVMKANGAYELPAQDLPRLEKVIFEKGAGPRGHAVVNRKFVGKNASVILAELGISAGPEVRTVLVEVSNEHPLIWTEQMMPVLPITRVKTAGEAIELGLAAEGANYHTATMHSRDIVNLSEMAHRCNCSIFVKNGPNLAGLGYGGEGYTSFTIASPTGEGLTGPRQFSRWRRCTIVENFRIT